jgi:hypothetical protein
VKRIRGDEPIWVVLHIFMETSPENSLSSYLYVKLAKLPYFPFYLLSSTKLENRRAEQVLWMGLREGLAQWEGGGSRERR